MRTRSGVALPAAVVALVAGLVSAGAAGAATPPRPAAAAVTATLRTVSGVVTGVDPTRRGLRLAQPGGTSAIVLTSGATVTVHDRPATLADVRTGMTVFAMGRGTADAFVATRATALRAGVAVTLTGRITAVDPAGALLLLQTGPELSEVLLVPTAVRLGLNGRRIGWGGVRNGQIATVVARPDAVTASQAVALSVELQPAAFAADQEGLVAGVDATTRELTLVTRAGRVVAAVPVTTPVLASGVPYQLDYLQLQAGARLQWARAADGQVLRTARGTRVARIVEDDQLVQ